MIMLQILHHRPPTTNVTTSGGGNKKLPNRRSTRRPPGSLETRFQPPRPTNTARRAAAPNAAPSTNHIRPTLSCQIMQHASRGTTTRFIQFMSTSSIGGKLIYS